MNINFTALSRSLRLFAAPALLLAASLILSLCAANYTAGTSPILDMLMHTFERQIYWAALACFVVGAFWYGYNLWQLYRWERGDLIGGCLHCGGTVSHLSGRFGAYSKCKMCGHQSTDSISVYGNRRSGEGRKLHVSPAEGSDLSKIRKPQKCARYGRERLVGEIEFPAATRSHWFDDMKHRIAMRREATTKDM